MKDTIMGVDARYDYVKRTNEGLGSRISRIYIAKWRY